MSRSWRFRPQVEQLESRMLLAAIPFGDLFEPQRHSKEHADERENRRDDRGRNKVKPRKEARSLRSPRRDANPPQIQQPTSPPVAPTIPEQPREMLPGLPPLVPLDLPGSNTSPSTPDTLVPQTGNDPRLGSTITPIDTRSTPGFDPPANGSTDRFDDGFRRVFDTGKNDATQSVISRLDELPEGEFTGSTTRDEAYASVRSQLDEVRAQKRLLTDTELQTLLSGIPDEAVRQRLLEKITRRQEHVLQKTAAELEEVDATFASIDELLPILSALPARDLSNLGGEEDDEDELYLWTRDLILPAIANDDELSDLVDDEMRYQREEPKSQNPPPLEEGTTVVENRPLPARARQVEIMDARKARPSVSEETFISVPRPPSLSAGPLVELQHQPAVQNQPDRIQNLRSQGDTVHLQTIDTIDVRK